MLPASHDRAYQDFLTLLTEFKEVIVKAQQKDDVSVVSTEFYSLSSWFQQHISSLDDRNIASAIAPRWQSVQTEIKREFKLLSTDLLFLASAKQNSTRQKKLQSIELHLTKLVGYCQIFAAKDNN